MASPAEAGGAPDTADAMSELTAELARLPRSAAAAHLREALLREGLPAAATAQALLLQPQAQLRAHGLLAARWAGRADLLLEALSAAGVWRAAACHLCQMELDAGATAELLAWLLHRAPRAQRCYLLTRLGRLPPRRLGAALFSALLTEGRPEDAARLVRHAELCDEELRALLRQHLVEEQDWSTLPPTWTRQAWKWLAVQRPALALELLQELMAKCEDDGCDAFSPLLMLRRAVLALLHGAVGDQAAAALCKPEKAFSKPSASFQYTCLREGVIRRYERRFTWFHLRRLVSQLQKRGIEEGGVADGTARAVFLAVFYNLPTLDYALRWVHRLQRRGLLHAVLEQATLLALRAAPAAALRRFCRFPVLVPGAYDGASDGARRVLRAVHLACADDPTAAGLLAGIVAGDAYRVLRTRAKDAEEEPWRTFPGDPNLGGWPVAALREGVALAQRECSGDEAMVQALERVRGFLEWSPEHRAAALAPLRNQPEATTRAEAYCELLNQDVPRTAAAANDIVPWVMGRMKNERSVVREKVLEALVQGSGESIWEWGVYAAPKGCLLARVGDEHLPAVEGALLAALAAPDAGERLRGLVDFARMAILQAGMLRPERSALAAGLRLHAATFGRRFPPRRGVPDEEEESEVTYGSVHSWTALEPALSRDALAASSDPARAVGAVLAQALPLYRESGYPQAAARVLAHLAEAGASPAGRCRLAALRNVPELARGVEDLLAEHFQQVDAAHAELSGTARRPDARAGGHGWGSGRGQGRGPVAAQNTLRFGGSAEICLEWWLGGPDDQTALDRAQALLAPTQEGSHAGARRSWFLTTSLSSGWLMWHEGKGGKGPTPPVARWWQRLVLSEWALLERLADHHPRTCRQLMRAQGASGPLAHALEREQLWRKGLLSVLPSYDSAALAEVLDGPAEGRLQRMEEAVAGYQRSPAEGFWEIKRQLRQCDYARYPPAVQAQLRRLCSGVAGAREVGAGARVAAVCLLARLQDTHLSELAAWVDEPEMTAACLLLAPSLADKREAASFLLRKLDTDVATHAASALRRVTPFLAEGEVVEAASDMLSTVGLRAAAWQQVVGLLVKQGGPQAIELVLGEMRRADLTASQRCALLGATGGLLASEAVRVFWTECAGLEDNEVGLALISSPDVALLRRDEGALGFWADTVLGMVVRSGADSKLACAWAGELAACAVFKAYAKHPAALDCLPAALFQLAAGGDGWELAVFLLRKLPVPVEGARLRGRDELARLRGHMQLLVTAAAAEFAEPGAAELSAGGGAGPSARLLLELAGPGPLPSPFRLGCVVPPVLLPALWLAYVEHVATCAWDKRRLASDHGASAVAELVEAALAAAPTAAHALQLAALLAGGQLGESWIGADGRGRNRSRSQSRNRSHSPLRRTPAEDGSSSDEEDEGGKAEQLLGCTSAMLEATRLVAQGPAPARAAAEGRAAAAGGLARAGWRILSQGRPEVLEASAETRARVEQLQAECLEELQCDMAHDRGLTALLLGAQAAAGSSDARAVLDALRGTARAGEVASKCSSALDAARRRQDAAKYKARRRMAAYCESI